MRTTLAALSLLGMVGCGLLKKSGDDGADAGTDAKAVDVPTPAAPSALAANADNVTRFPDETTSARASATLQRKTNVREIPVVGRLVATLAKGAAVSSIAQRGAAVLVTFEDPQDHKTLMGWIGEESFTPAPAASKVAAKVPICATPEVSVMGDGPFCGRVCTSDSSCPAGQACRGAANTFSNGVVGSVVTLCTTFTPRRVAAGAPVAGTGGAALVAPSAPAAAPVAPPPASPSATPPAPIANVTTAPDGRPFCRDSESGSACVTLPKTDRVNGMECHADRNCRSQNCCRAQAGGKARCTPQACPPEPSTPEPASRDDDRPSASRGSSPASKKPEPKGLGEKCQFNSDCASKICGTLSSGSLHKCVSKH